MIADKLAQHDELFDKTLDKAIKEKDSFAVFSMLGKKVEHKSDNTLEIETYKPIYVADKQKGITIPYSMMGIEEDVLLRNVSKIKGDMMLYNKNFIYNSQIKEFPQKQKKLLVKLYVIKSNMTSSPKISIELLMAILKELLYMINNPFYTD